MPKWKPGIGIGVVVNISSGGGVRDVQPGGSPGSGVVTAGYGTLYGGGLDTVTQTGGTINPDDCPNRLEFLERH